MLLLQLLGMLGGNDARSTAAGNALLGTAVPTGTNTLCNFDAAGPPCSAFYAWNVCLFNC